MCNMCKYGIFEAKVHNVLITFNRIQTTYLNYFYPKIGISHFYPYLSVRYTIPPMNTQ